MTMKRYLTIFLILLLCLSACGKESEPPKPGAAVKAQQIQSLGAYYYPWYEGPGVHWEKDNLRQRLTPPQEPVLGEYNCREEKVIEELVATTEFKIVDDEAVVAAAAKLSGLPEAKISRAFLAKTSVFNKFTMEKETSIAFLKLALADILADESILVRGHTGLLIPKAVSHVLKVCLIADMSSRTQSAVIDNHIPEKVPTLRLPFKKRRVNMGRFNTKGTRGSNTHCRIIMIVTGRKEETPLGNAKTDDRIRTVVTQIDNIHTHVKGGGVLTRIHDAHPQTLHHHWLHLNRFAVRHKLNLDHADLTVALHRFNPHNQGGSLES